MTEAEEPDYRRLFGRLFESAPVEPDESPTTFTIRLPRHLGTER
ncbi:hypothetical protein [Actinoplanes utahensis]|nr:hypothetical protein [Actinoplanes utahensis]